MPEVSMRARLRTLFLVTVAAPAAVRAAAATDPLSLAPALPPTQPAQTITVYNRGIGGDNTGDGLRRLDQAVLARPPNHLVLFSGMNDALNSARLVALDRFRQDLHEMVRRARAKGVTSIVFVTPNPIVAEYVRDRRPTHPEADLQAHLGRYAACAAQWAPERNNSMLSDVVLGYAARLAGEVQKSWPGRRLATAAYGGASPEPPPYPLTPDLPTRWMA
jgi:hypothetical protein